MINSGRLLRSLVGGALGGGGRRGRRRRRLRGGLGGVATGAVGMGALGVAIAAYEHFTQKPGVGAPNAPAAPAPSVPSHPALPVSVPPPLPAVDTAPVAPPPLPGTVAPGDAEQSDEALLLVRAMIAAANADHALDATERARIERTLSEADVSDEERVFLRVEMERPWGLGQLVEAATTPDLAREVYLASIMAIEVDSDAERNYLTRLAERLGLDAAATGEIKALLEPDDEAPHS